MLQDLARTAIIENTPQSVFARRMSFRLDSTPLRPGEISFKNPDMMNTSGAYTIRYNIDTRKCRNSDRFPFVFNCDLFVSHKIRVSSYEDLMERAKTDNIVKWLTENTSISEDLFRIAEAHRDMPIPFSVDIVKYEKRLKAAGETRTDFLWEVE